MLGWDNLDTALHLDAVAEELTRASRLACRRRRSAGLARGLALGLHPAPPRGHHHLKDLSIRLAELARAIRDRIKTALAIETEDGPLTQADEGVPEALVHDLDADGFADMYAQTIAYGLLSARIADPTSKTADDLAAHMRTNPFLRELMETFLNVGGRARAVGQAAASTSTSWASSEVVELLDSANMEAVVRDFGDRNPQEDPVIHFYELFLKEYDPKRR